MYNIYPKWFYFNIFSLECCLHHCIPCWSYPRRHIRKKSSDSICAVHTDYMYTLPPIMCSSQTGCCKVTRWIFMESSAIWKICTGWPVKHGRHPVLFSVLFIPCFHLPWFGQWGATALRKHNRIVYLELSSRTPLTWYYDLLLVDTVFLYICIFFNHS